MSLLNSISIDYTQEEGSVMIVPTIVSTEIYALANTSADTPQELTLGASGDIVFFVDDKENSLRLSVEDGTSNMQISTSNSVMQLLPGDTDRTIMLDDLTFTKNGTENVITSSNSSTLRIVSGTEIILSSTVNVLNDMNLTGQLYTPNINIANANCGFMFQLNTDSNLELIKYDKSQEHGQLVATFGQGSFISDNNYPYSEYGGSGGGSYGVSGDSYGASGGTSVWSISEDNISYVNGTTTVLDLTVQEVATFNSNVIIASNLTVNTIEILEGISIQSIILEDADNYPWNGHASNLYGLSNLALSALSNDLNLQSDPNMSSESITTSNLTVLDLGTFNSNVIIHGDVTIHSNLVVDSIEIIGGIEIQSIVFEDLGGETPHVWDGHASNLYGLSNLALSALSNDLNIQSDPNVSSDLITTSNLNVLENATFENATFNDTVSFDFQSGRRMNVDYLFNEGWIESHGTIYTKNLSGDTSRPTSFQFKSSSDPDEDKTLPDVIHLTGSIIPTTSNEHYLGSYDRPFHSLFLGSNSMYLGQETTLSATTDENGNTSMNILGASIKPEGGLKFADGSKLGSMQDVANQAITAVSLNTALPFGDFTNLSISYKAGKTLLTGNYTYSQYYEPSDSTFRSTYNLYDYQTKNIPMKSDGSGFEATPSYRHVEGNSTNINSLNILGKGNHFYTNNVLLSGPDNSNIEHATQLYSYVKNSSAFKNKFITDFTFIERVYSEEYINTNDNTPTNVDALDTTVECIVVLYLPLVDAVFLDDAVLFQYLVPGSPSARLHTHYELNTDPNTSTTSYILIQTPGTKYQLYPKISIVDWKNTFNDSQIIDSSLDKSDGWDSIEDVFSRFTQIPDINGTNVDWILQLFKLTYAYIKHGDSYHTLTDVENTMLDNDYNALDSSNITFIDDVINISATSTAISRTKVVFTEETMAKYAQI